MGLSQMWSSYVSGTAARRPFWFFVYYAFNQVDEQRLRKLGPDRTCAEWILRNGGSVSFSDRPTALHRNYNALPPERTALRLHTIEAHDIGLIACGFEHLRGCRHVQRIVLRDCAHLDDDALARLRLVGDTLSELEVCGCRQVRSEGVRALVALTQLRRLRLGDLKGVGDLGMVVREMRAQLPDCSVELEDEGA